MKAAGHDKTILLPTLFPTIYLNYVKKIIILMLVVFYVGNKLFFVLYCIVVASDERNVWTTGNDRPDWTSGK